MSLLTTLMHLIKVINEDEIIHLTKSFLMFTVILKLLHMWVKPKE